MFKLNILAAACTAAVFLLCGPPLAAQDMVLNGYFDFESTEKWTESGGTTGCDVVQYDVTGGGSPSWCYMREPGTNGGNGSILQDVLLIGGVTYQFDADVAYYTC